MKTAKPSSVGRSLPIDEPFPKNDGDDAVRLAGEALKTLAGERLAGVPVKRAIETAARLAGLDYWRAFDLWYGKARRVEQFEIDQIGDAVEKKDREDARNAIRRMQTELARLEARLTAGDEAFHSPFLDALRQAKGARR
jgi:hypothetical protein